MISLKFVPAIVLFFSFVVVLPLESSQYSALDKLQKPDLHATNGVPQNCKFPAIFNFGDSNSDTGGAYILYNENKWPNGITLGKESKRASDGLLIIDFFAESLGIPLLNASVDLNGTSFRYGANFVLGGQRANSDSDPYSNTRSYPLSEQVSRYLAFKMHAIASKADIYPDIGVFSEALFTIDIGQNDVQGLFLDKKISPTLDDYTKSVKRLLDDGGKYMWIHNTCPFGCLPIQMEWGCNKQYMETCTRDQYGCIIEYNKLSQHFNSELKKRVDQLRIQYPQSMITLVDMYSAKYNLFANSKGFENALKFKYCCGKSGVSCAHTGVNEKNVTEFGSACEDPSKYISWDGRHYSQAANKVIVNLVLDGTFSEPSVPLSNACKPNTKAFLMVPEAQDLPQCDFHTIINFGDSNSDTSVAVSVPTSGFAVARSSTFFAKNPKRKVCDGLLIIDLIAERLELPYLSAFLDKNNTDFEQGVNFAVGGARIFRRRMDISYPDFLNQTDQFRRFKNRISDLPTQGIKPNGLPTKDLSKALYTIDIGQNDVSTSMWGGNFRELPFLIQRFALGIKNLYEDGARFFWIHNTGPTGCLSGLTKGHPSYVSAEVDEFGCLKAYNDVAKEFNKQLKEKIVQLRVELKETTMTYVDLYSAKYKLFSNAKSLGFTDPFGFCINATFTCTNPGKYILWDGFHYTETANRLVAEAILNGSLSNPSLAIKYACHS